MRKQNDNMKYVTHSYYLFREFIVISKDKYNGKGEKLMQEEKNIRKKVYYMYLWNITMLWGKKKKEKEKVK